MLLLCTQVTLCLWHGGTRWCQEVWHPGGLIVGNPEGFLGGHPKTSCSQGLRTGSAGFDPNRSIST